MSKGPEVWSPMIDQPDRERLERFLAVMEEGDLQSLSEGEVTQGASLMKLEEVAWQILEDFTDDELEKLVRFFTLAEARYPGWEGGRRSPVIYMVRILKRRHAFTADLRKWIKANTDNRYLPYGSAL